MKSNRSCIHFEPDEAKALTDRWNEAFGDEIASLFASSMYRREYMLAAAVLHLAETKAERSYAESIDGTTIRIQRELDVEKRHRAWARTTIQELIEAHRDLATTLLALKRSIAEVEGCDNTTDAEISEIAVHTGDPNKPETAATVFRVPFSQPHDSATDADQVSVPVSDEEPLRPDRFKVIVDVSGLEPLMQAQKNVQVEDALASAMEAVDEAVMWLGDHNVAALGFLNVASGWLAVASERLQERDGATPADERHGAGCLDMSGMAHSVNREFTGRWVREGERWIVYRPQWPPAGRRG